MRVISMVAAGLLAGGALAAGGAVAQAAPASGHGHGTPTESCRKWAAAHTFVWIRKASGNPRTGLTLTGDKVRVHCGGPDDFQYIVTSKRFTGHLLPSAKITVISDANGLTFPRLAESKLPRWVAHDTFGNIYGVTGPFKAIRVLTEEYHP